MCGVYVQTIRGREMSIVGSHTIWHYDEPEAVTLRAAIDNATKPASTTHKEEP